MIGEEAVDEKFVLEFAAFREWKFCCAFDGVDGGLGSFESTRLFGGYIAGGSEDGGVFGGVA